MPGAIHAALASIRARVAQIDKSNEMLREQIWRDQEAIAQNEADRAHCVKRIAELEPQLRPVRR